MPNGPRAALAHRYAPAYPDRTARRRLGAQRRGLAGRYPDRRRDRDRHRPHHQRRLPVRQASGRGEGRGGGHGRPAQPGRRPAHRRAVGQPLPALARCRAGAARAFPAAARRPGGADRASVPAAAGPAAPRARARRGGQAGLNPSTSDGEAQAPGSEALGAEALRDRLRDVYWIGGGSGAGKSTVARRLAAPHGLRLYATDGAMADHGRRSTPADSPFLAEFAAMDMDERWVSRPPETMLETFHWFRGEGFGLIVADLLRLPPGVIAEGFRLLPRLVRPVLSDPGRAVWLCPTPGFRRAA